MRQGRRPLDPGLVDSLFDREMRAARELEASGRGLEALWRYETICRTFGAMRDIGTAMSRVRELGASPTVRRESKDREHWDAWESRYSGRLARGNTQLMNTEMVTSQRQLLGTFGIGDLKKRATRDGYEGVVAQRILERIWTHTSFYIARDLLEQKRYRDAMTSLSIAVEIRDDNPIAWYNLACAAARAGSTSRALEALEKAIEAGFRDAAHMREDRDLESLREHPRYLGLLERVSG